MFWRIVRHEWRALAADHTVWLVAAVFALAIGYGVWTGHRWVSFQRAAIEQTQVEETERYTRLQQQVADLQQGGKVSPFADPRNPSNAGGRLAPRYATLRPGPMAATASGKAICSRITSESQPTRARTSLRRRRLRTRTVCSSDASTSRSC